MDVDAEDVQRLAAGGEGARVEFKRGLPRAPKVARTLAAFANTRGGHFMVGVDDRGRLIGAPRPDRTAVELAEIGRTLVEPPIDVATRVVRVGDVRVVVGWVRASDRRPHSVERAPGERETPVRVGSSTRAAAGATLRSLSEGRRPGGRSGLDAFERAVLAWVERQGDSGTSGQGRCTPRAFAKARNVGVARARRAFVKLERSGHLLAHGEGAGRTYGLP
jgi:hypothetical protein